MLTATTRQWAPQGLSARCCRVLSGIAVAGLIVGCSLDGVLGNEDLPPDLSDPAITKTPAGAMAAYRGTLAQFRRAFGGVTNNTTSGIGTSLGNAAGTFPVIAGLLSDELGNSGVAPGMGTPSADADARYLPEFSTASAADPSAEPYLRLQRARGQAGQAIELLRRYAPDSSPLVGHLYALQGYTEVLLAELFCSGIPLSTIDFDGDYTLKPGSSTQEVLEHTLVFFDSALALSGDSTRFVHLARMGRARALLNLGRFAEAAATAAQVPDAYQYTISFSAVSGTDAVNFAQSFSGFTVSDREGVNGLDFRSSNDPRSRVTARGTNPNSGQTIWHPDKYAINGSSPIVLASGVEARLIDAEADLRAGGTQWLTILNTLRTNGQIASTYTRLDRRGISSGVGAPQTGSPGPAGVIDTTWGPGTGIGMIPSTVIADAGPVCPSSASPGTVCTDTVWYKGLRPLTDPGTPESRIDVLFRERAFWLFLTGQRQRDLRRLVRQYGRQQESVYPTGPYTGGFPYGSEVTLPVPFTERANNSAYDGCLGRDA